MPRMIGFASLGLFLLTSAFLPKPLAKSESFNSGQEGVVVTSGPLRFEEHLIMGGYTYSYGIEAADLDGDGDLDLTSADALPNNSLYWFENDGKGTFHKHFVQKDDPERLERHDIGDIDRDGDLDICIVKNLRGDLIWFENSGKPADGKLWSRHVITKGKLPGAYDVELVDLDGDGDLDAAASSWTPGSLFAWFENDGTPADGEWTMRVIEDNIRETRAILAADIDGDGDPDLVGTGSGASLVVWYENSGKPATTPFVKHVIDDRSLRPIHGDLVDMDGDGDIDVLMAFGMGLAGNPKADHLAWYENDGTPADGPWKKHVIDGDFTGAFEAVAADLDGDTDLDVVATNWFGPGWVAWLENTGDPKTGWKRHMLKDKWVRANQVITADFDADGKPDIAAGAERGTLEVRWWRNLGAAREPEAKRDDDTQPKKLQTRTDADRQSNDDDSLAIFKRRILPIMQAKNPSSCTECHLSGVDLKEYILPDQAQTFAALRDRGLIDLANPDNSKILQFIARKPKQPSLLTDKIRKQELEAFREWIRAAVRNPDVLAAVAGDDALGATLSVEVIRHARQDSVLTSFIDNVWSEVGRCAACHSPDRNQKQVREHGEQVSWIKLRDPQATLKYMLDAGLIDTDVPEKSLLLLKPTNQLEHGGGQKLVVGDRTYKQFRGFIDDYAAIVKGKYRSADELPKPRDTVSNVSEIWFKLTEVPARYDKMLLQVNLYRKEGNGWSDTPWAIGDRAAFGKGQLWQQHLTLVAPRDSKRAAEIRRQPRLPAGTYLARIFIDTRGKLQQDFEAVLDDGDFVGQVIVDSRWPDGYQQMTQAAFPKSKR